MKRREERTENKDSKVRIAAIGLCLFSLSVPLAAQIQLGGLGRSAQANRHHVELLTDSVQVLANKPQDVEVRFRVEPGFHINSHTPKDELLIPTELRLDKGAARVWDERYPPGSRFRLAIGAGEDLDVYQGQFRVIVHVQAPKGNSTLTGVLHYQACDGSSCFPAKNLPVKIALNAQ